jgi:filamentous hemagglutinin family protein
MQLDSSLGPLTLHASHNAYHRTNRIKFAILIITGALILDAHAAPPLPKGGQFTAGSGTISAGDRSVVIDQTSSRGVIDWNSFSIGSGRTVTFNNGSGATLSRVTGAEPSVILGRLNASGSVYLLNGQGVLVGPGGVVATGGRFVASTLNIGNDAFMQGGPLTLSGGGEGAIVNLGHVSSSGADVFLVSRRTVVNSGSISAPKGTTELAVGSQVLLQDASGNRQVFVQAGSGGTVVDTGLIQAAQVSLQAADGNVYALAGKSAAIRATGTATRDGHVWLVAETGGVHVGIDVSASNGNGAGGTVETRGNTLDLGGSVQAATWKIGAPTLTVGSSLMNSLSVGTSVDVETSKGDLNVNGDVEWSGAASLKLGAAHNVVIAPQIVIANTGSGTLTLRADNAGANNGGSIANGGTIDWSKSTGIVSALYDMTGSFTPGAIVANNHWTAAPYSGLVTQITGYKLVNNMADLQNVARDVSGNYALGKDIDASGTNAFNPIGAMQDAPFTGQFDGMGHTIDKLTISSAVGTTRAAGLFGVVGEGAVVRDVHLTNASIPSVQSFGSFGLLAGINYGLVTDSSTSGNLSDVRSLSRSNDGGLVGSNYGTVERSSSRASIVALSPAGGLVGFNDGTIRQSFADGSLSRCDCPYGGTGGLVGTNSGLVTQSYATGYVQDAGLVHRNEPTGVVDQSFAANLVSGPGGGGSALTGPGGGIAFYNDGTIHNNVYWDKTVTTQTSAFDFGSGASPPDSNGLTSTQMSNASSFLGWNIRSSGVWSMPAGATHPVLQWQQGR